MRMFRPTDRPTDHPSIHPSSTIFLENNFYNIILPLLKSYLDGMEIANNIIKLNGLILILFVFRTYLKITKILLPLLNVYKKTKVIRKVMYEIKKIHT